MGIKDGYYRMRPIVHGRGCRRSAGYWASVPGDLSFQIAGMATSGKCLTELMIRLLRVGETSVTTHCVRGAPVRLSNGG